MSGSNQLLVSSGTFLSHARRSLLPILLVVLLVAVKPSLFMGAEILDRTMVATGILMALVGQGLRLLTLGYHIPRGGKNRQVYANTLLVKGFYAHTRNPRYLGNFLITVGLGFLYGSLLAAVIVIAFFGFVYVCVIAAEEDSLKRRFGQEYDDYSQRVNRFWPKLHGIRESLKEFDHFDWRRALRKDSDTILGWVVGLVFILSWKCIYLYGWGATKAELAVLAVVLILAVLFYAVVRYLEANDLLVSPSYDDYSDHG